MTDVTDRRERRAVTDGPGPPSSARIDRVDDRLGLAVHRVGLSGRSLVTYARDHVTVRTPSRPDFRDGNTLDLLAVPAPGDLWGWVDRYAETIGMLGVEHVQLRWEVPLAADAPAEAPDLDPELASAAQELGLRPFPLTVLLLDGLREPPRALGDMVPVPPPTAESSASVDRRWHAATVLYRYMEGEEPDDWRDLDQAFVQWQVEVQRELALAERCQVWLTLRHGGPVARLHVVHDQQGLAAVEDVVVHPVVRRHGIAAALTYKAVSTHLAVHPGSRVGVVAEPGSTGDRLYRRLGFRPHATIWAALRLLRPDA
jgi:GNAT superfamily N-acetyltransferase